MLFTRTSLLVVVGIVGLFVGICAQSMKAANEAARKMSCSNSLKQIGLALHTYHDTYSVFPPNGLYLTTAESNNLFVGGRSSRGSSLCKLTPYMISHPFYNSLDFEIAGEPWGFERQLSAPGSRGPKRVNPPKTRVAMTFVVSAYLCASSGLDPYLDRDQNLAAISCYAPSMGSQRMPSYGGWCEEYRGDQFGTGSTPYALTTNPNAVSGVFAKGHWAASFSDIKDGQSQVIAFGEILPNKSDYQALGWLHSYAFPAATTSPINYPVIGIGERGFPGPGGCHHYKNRQTSDGFRSRHKGGAQFVMCDGSTQFISEDIDYLTYQRLGDRRDGQPLGGNWAQR